MPKVRAPELIGAGGWIGTTQPLTLAALRGQVVVLGFWALGCVESQRVLADLAEVEARWPDQVLVVGVHCPKFPYEADHGELLQAVARLGITHPILDDPELVTWQQYGVKGWPTVIVVDAKGFVAGAAMGEGNGTLIMTVVGATVAEHERRRTLRPVRRIAVLPVPPPGLLAFPSKVASDRRDRIVIADTGHDRVLVAELNLEGTPRARLTHVISGVSRPQGVRLYGRELLICDTDADRVLRIDLAARPGPEEDIVADSAGILRLRIRPDEVLASGLASPWDVVADTDRSFVVAEAGRHRLWRISADGRSPGVIAGDRYQGLADAVASKAELAQPSGVARVGVGIAFVDSASSALRILSDRGKVGTLVGHGLFDWGLRDGGGNRARMQHPQGVAASIDGAVLYIADTFNSALRVWSRGDLLTLPAQGLSSPGGLDVLPDGRLIVADTNNHRIVVVNPVDGGVEPVVFERVAVVSPDPTVQPGMEIVATAGAPFAVPFGLTIDPYRLDPDIAAPVALAVDCSPAWLLDHGPRTWAHTLANGALTLDGGSVGQGWLTITVAAALCGDGASTIRRSVTRHPLIVR